MKNKNEISGYVRKSNTKKLKTKKISTSIEKGEKESSKKAPKIIIKFDTDDLKNMISNILHNEGWSYDDISKLLKEEEYFEDIETRIKDRLVDVKIWEEFINSKFKELIIKDFFFLWCFFGSEMTKK